eukprot:514094_1
MQNITDNDTVGKSYDYMHKNPSAPQLNYLNDSMDVQSDIVLHTEGYLKRMDVKPSAPQKQSCVVSVPNLDERIKNEEKQNLKIIEKTQRIIHSNNIYSFEFRSKPFGIVFGTT